MKNRQFWRRSLALVSAIAMLASGSIFAAAEPVDPPALSLHTPEISKNGDWINRAVDLSSGAEQPTAFTLKATALPTSYNSKTLGYAERLENQGTHNLCWAFVQNTLAAINVKKDEGKSVNYSEIHMAYSLSSANSNALGYDRLVDDGGNYEIALAYLARGSGMVTEADDPFISGALPARTAAKTDSYFSTGYLEEAPILFDCSLRQVKELIYEYGAVGASLYYNDAYYDSSTHIYYCGSSMDANHGVTLIGWDDSLRCFLAQNSWGSSWGNGGYFWISYDDRQICSNVYAIDYQSGDLPYDGIRSYNDFGWVSYLEGEAGKSLYYSTTYDTGNAQTLEGIGTYTLAANTKLDIYINPYDGDGKTSSKFKLVHSETFANSGYYHISFDNPVYLYGSKFNVKIRTTSATGGISLLPLQANYSNYLSNSEFQRGRSYYGMSNGVMRLLEDSYNLLELTRAGWTWAMQAFTNSDLSIEAHQSKISLSGETYQVILSQVSNGKYSLLRNETALSLYTNAACTSAYSGNTLATGTYYMKLQNGTHIRRKVIVSRSTISPQWSLSGISGAESQPDGYHAQLSGWTFSPTVSCDCSDWNFYALPGGVGKIGKSFSPSRYHTVIYFRLTAADGIATYEYPVHIYTRYSSTSGFSDWSKISSWAERSMGLIVEYGIMKGDGGKIEPQTTLSRAQAATILMAAAGIESSKVGNENAAVFGDVNLDSWYADAVSTAVTLGVVSGHNDPGYRAFSPSNPVTREQFAIMVLRLKAFLDGVDYQSYINANLSAAKSWMSRRGFVDGSSVSSWAYDAVCVALYMSVFDGSMNNGRLYIQPKKNITREQAAVMLYSSIDSIY